MFLISITENKIRDELPGFNIHKFKIDSKFITVIENKKFFKFFECDSGFSLFEAPINGLENNDIISGLSYITFDGKNKIKAFRSPLTGKPIYYTQFGKDEYIFSDMKIIREIGIPIKENKNTIPEFFSFRYVMPPNTFFKDIYQLNIGDLVVCNIRNNGRKEIKQQTFPSKNKNTNFKRISKKLVDLLYESIEKLKIHEKNITCLLSGGLDSSMIVKICQELFDLNKTYSTGYPFEEKSLNIEKKYATSAAESMGLKHQYYEGSIRDYLNSLIDGIYYTEIPLHHLQSTCLNMLYKNKIPNEKKIIIEGWGAGGAFGNFRNYLFYLNKPFVKYIAGNNFTYRVLKKGFSYIGKGNSTINLLHKSIVCKNLENPDHPIWHSHEYGNGQWVCNQFNISRRDIIKNHYVNLIRFKKRSLFDMSALYSLFGDEDSTLSVLSKLSESNGKFHYFPFYYLKILKTVFNVPWDVKLRYPENSIRKRMAKEIGVPSFIIKRPKTGFGINSKEWRKPYGPFEPIIPIVQDVFSLENIRKVQSSQNESNAMIFWNMINYTIWKKIFVDGIDVKELKNRLNENM